MKPSTKRILSIFGSLASIFAAFIILSNNVLPAWNQVTSLRIGINERVAARDRLQGLVDQARDYIGREDELNRRVQPIDAALPTSPQIPELIATLDALATRSDVVLSRLSFQQEPPAAATEQGENARERGVSRVSISTGVVGTYSDLRVWLRSVERELRLLDVEALSLSPLAAGERVTEDMPINVSVTLVAYWQE